MLTPYSHCDNIINKNSEKNKLNTEVDNMKRIIMNTEIAQAVCKKIPEANFEDILRTIDIGRSTYQEKIPTDKSIIKTYIHNLKQDYDGEI